eukprot:gene8156-16770_t
MLVAKAPGSNVDSGVDQVTEVPTNGAMLPQIVSHSPVSKQKNPYLVDMGVTDVAVLKRSNSEKHKGRVDEISNLSADIFEGNNHFEDPKFSTALSTLPETLERDMHLEKAKLLTKVLGVDEEEMKRNKALLHLGVTNQDAHTAEMLMHSIPEPSNKKEEKITGYTLSQMKRVKAINMLGESEEAIAEETSKALAALGIGHTSHNFYSNLPHFTLPSIIKKRPPAYAAPNISPAIQAAPNSVDERRKAIEGHNSMRNIERSLSRRGMGPNA